MSTPPSPKALQALLEEAAPDLDLTFRPMFGGIMGYTNGAPFASISNVGIAFKFGGETFRERSAVPGAAPLRYEPQSPPSKSYVVAPALVVSDLGSLAEWARLSASQVKRKRERSAGS